VGAKDFHSLRLFELHPSIYNVSFNFLDEGTRKYPVSNLSVHKTESNHGMWFVKDSFSVSSILAVYTPVKHVISAVRCD
jgi:hypothetical protein